MRMACARNGIIKFTKGQRVGRHARAYLCGLIDLFTVFEGAWGIFRRQVARQATRGGRH
jgi:hypothetical protein